MRASCGNHFQVARCPQTKGLSPGGSRAVCCGLPARPRPPRACDPPSCPSALPALPARCWREDSDRAEPLGTRRLLSYRSNASRGTPPKITQRRADALSSPLG